MADSVVAICNFALSHVGDSKGIVLITEATTPARACNQWYEQCRDEVLRAFPWPFATMPGSTLALVETLTATTDEWSYSYAYPADALAVVRLPWGSSRNPTTATRTKYSIVRKSTGGRLLYTDQDAATISYIVKITDVGEFPPDFVAALSYLLASRICATVTSENRKENTVFLLQMYEKTLGKAMMAAANEVSPDVEPDSGFATSRA